jgi:hypothetical protein
MPAPTKAFATKTGKRLAKKDFQDFNTNGALKQDFKIPNPLKAKPICSIPLLKISSGRNLKEPSACWAARPGTVWK